MDTSTIFQRTESGRDTIKTKSQKLTQSERLMLIIIDGVTPYDVLRKEVWSLSQDRFERALGTLLKKELISEVLLPIQGQEAEQLDAAEVDRFLQQDPLDPVTIISFDPEDEFGAGFNPFAPALASSEPKPSAPATPREPVVLEVPVPAPAAFEELKDEEPSPDVDSEDLALKSLSIKLAHDKEQEAAFPAVPPVSISKALLVEPVPNFPDEWPETLDEDNSAPSRIQWIYWIALVSGIGIILASLLSRAFA